MKKPENSPRNWALLFTAFFLLSMDFWSWTDQPASGPLGLPWWVFYFAALQFALSAALYFFSTCYWRDEPDTAAEDG